MAALNYTHVMYGGRVGAVEGLGSGRVWGGERLGMGSPHESSMGAVWGQGQAFIPSLEPRSIRKVSDGWVVGVKTYCSA